MKPGVPYVVTLTGALGVFTVAEAVASELPLPSRGLLANGADAPPPAAPAMPADNGENREGGEQAPGPPPLRTEEEARQPSRSAPIPPPPPDLPGRPDNVLTVVERLVPNPELVGGGVAMLGFGYAGAVLVGAASDCHADRDLFLPIVGPWIDLRNRDTSLAIRNCDGNPSAHRVLLLADGLFQGIGALQILAGFLVPERHTVTEVGSAKPVLHFAPTVGATSVGVVVSGTF